MKLTNEFIIDKLFSNNEILAGFIEANNEAMDKLFENSSLNEDIEKHNELNPKLWNENNTLKDEVKEKINLIVEEFLDSLKENEVSINLKDIVLVGSNCSYNYNKDSDLDIHLIAENIEAPENLYNKIYSAYRSIFNKNLDIDFYGIPVEIFVEPEDNNGLYNGVYSVMQDKWLQEPVAEDIPEIDQEALDKEVKVWEDRYSEIISEGDKELKEGFIGKIDQVVELPDFEDARKEFHLSDEDMAIAINEIKQNPNIGDVIQGCHGARKLRIAIAANNKGKSGGARAAYLNYYPAKTAYFISIIVKSDQEDFTAAQKKQITKAVDLIKK